MNCKISKNAAKMLKVELDKPENEGKKLRVYVTHAHGDHAHYGMGIDEPTEKDVVVSTDKDIDVILEDGNEFLDGVRIDYFYVPEEGFAITNPTKGNHGDH
ncbi:iron-sulfur cluster assembly accessory protein [Paenibacillus harenae]|uniref:Fe-S cluster assembly iron-binding protein IscA n=1 Tax=Paenibacillus harenae TaxID=306543 RepID=A0ABT9TWS1_PAEHA|nr:iron-sulfur cluster assembly accessory protein [Paenibacillus harenae]MDQ0058470.1 Fe-S cluster assembly iron-binding protein IscA [Paenibacillus harenae]MDQ0111812.1 Fe-S cluster assembly iron-binding protein IscA [Paenibacillus harenae]